MGDKTDTAGERLEQDTCLLTDFTPGVVRLSLTAANSERCLLPLCTLGHPQVK